MGRYVYCELFSQAEPVPVVSLLSSFSFFFFKVLSIVFLSHRCCVESGRANPYHRHIQGKLRPLRDEVAELINSTL
jgi:hypothetical protein